MSRLLPKKLADLSSDLQQVMESGAKIMGFTPNDGLIMAYKPKMLTAFLGLVESIYQPGSLETEIKKLAAIMTSSASGCQYCQAHTSFGALKQGVDANKITHIWEYQTHPLFSDAERIALDVARSAALVPNAVTEQHFEELSNHFNEEQIVELFGVISLFGFLNRWNASFNTDLESLPKQAFESVKQN